jgi:3-oxoacyl-[acyl-carrier-protein] synthase-3
MSIPAEVIGLNSFAWEFGERERTWHSIEEFAAICSAKGLPLSLAEMGCETFWQMTQPIESYVVRCVSGTTSSSGVPATAVNHIIFATMDSNLRHLDQNFAPTILSALGLVNCVPTFISMQRCVSSLAAVDHARSLFTDARVNHVIVVAFDFVIDDADRIRPWALYGDGVTSCMMSRGGAAGLAWLSYGVNVDFAGLSGSDTFESRKRVVDVTLGGVLKESGTRIENVEKCFSTNFYKPIALFNAGLCGIDRTRLGIDTLSSRAHCGNCDWMINLTHYERYTGFARGAKYMVQSYAPGFFACGLLESLGGRDTTATDG